MLLTRTRMSPWTLRARRVSSRRFTTTADPSTATVTSGSIRRSSLPFGPSTRTRSSATCTLTPAGTVMGSLPMRDMVASLPDRADDLAADVLAARVAIDEDALWRREDVHTEPAPHGRDVLHADVDAEARPAHAPHPGDHGATLSVVAEIDAQDVPRRRVDHRRALEIALVDEHARDLFLLARPRHVDARLARVVRVPDAGEKVGDGIGQHVGYQLAFVRPGICPRRARFRRQSRHMRKRRKNARGRPQ